MPTTVARLPHDESFTTTGIPVFFCLPRAHAWSDDSANEQTICIAILTLDDDYESRAVSSLCVSLGYKKIGVTTMLSLGS